MEDGKIFGVPRKPALIIGGGAVVFLGYMWWRNGKATDPVEYVDPNDIGATEYESPLGSSGTNSTGSFPGNVDPDAIDTNAKWTQAATDALEASGFDRGAIVVALGKWLTFQGLTPAEITIVTAARGVQGDPPTGGPYPMKEALPATASTSATVPARPTNLRVTAKSKSSLRLNWDPVPGATSYQIRWLSSMSFSTTPAFTVKALKANTTYNIYVCGRNAVGMGLDAVVSAKTPAK